MNIFFDQSMVLWNLVTAPINRAIPRTASATYCGQRIEIPTPLRKMPRRITRKYRRGLR